MILAKSAPWHPRLPIIEPKGPYHQKWYTPKPFFNSRLASSKALLYVFSGAVPHPRWWTTPAWGWDPSQVGGWGLSRSACWLMVHEEVIYRNQLQLCLFVFYSSGSSWIISIYYVLCMLYCWGKKTKTSLFLPLSKLCDKGLSPRNLHGGENWVQRWLYQLCWDTNLTYRFFSAWSLGAVSLHLLSKTIQEFFHLLSFSSFDQEASIFLTKKSCCRMQGKVYLYVLDTSNLHIFNRKRKNWVKNVAFAKIVYSGRRCSDTFFF